MNFCMKCQSVYAQPGTCNCFARTAPEIQPVPGVAPITPFVPYVPSVPPTSTPWWQTVVVTGTNVSTAGAVITNMIRADQLPAGTSASFTH